MFLLFADFLSANANKNVRNESFAVKNVLFYSQIQYSRAKMSERIYFD
jgi:hypothetical protein